MLSDLRKSAYLTGLSGVVRYSLPTLFSACVLRLLAIARNTRRGPQLLLPRTILILRPDGIGDVVLSSGMLRELRCLYPSAHVTIVVSTTARSIVENCPYVNEILDLPTEPMSRVTLKAALAFCKAALNRRAWDMVIVPRWDTDIYFGALMATYTGAPRRIAFSEKCSNQKRRANWGFDILYTDVLPPGHVKHEAERNLDIVRYLGRNVARTDLEVWPSPADRHYTEKSRLSFGSTESEIVIAFGVGARAANRRWPARHFAELISLLRQQIRFVPLIICGPNERLIGREIQAHTGVPLHLLEPSSLSQTAALLLDCALFIGNDSGPMHIAAAAGVPTVELSAYPLDGDPNSAASPKRFGPFTSSSAIIQPRHAKPPCKGPCAFDEAHCITDVPAAHVATQVLALLERGPSAARERAQQ